jgi:hypothetical protein
MLLPLFLPEFRRPVGDADWDPKVLDMLGVLSSMSLGQALLVREVLVEVSKDRLENEEENADELQVQDMLDTIQKIHQSAGLLDQKVCCSTPFRTMCHQYS